MNVGTRSLHGFLGLFLASATHGGCVIITLIVGGVLTGCTSIGAYSGVNLPLGEVPARSSGTVQNADELGYVYGLSTLVMFDEHVGFCFNPQMRVYRGSTSIYENVVEDTISFEVDGEYAWQARNVELMFALSYYPLDSTSVWQPYTTVGYVAAIPESVEAYGAPTVIVNTPHVSSSASARVGLLYGSTTGGYIKGPAESYHYLTLQVGTHYQFSSWARAGVGVTVNGTLNEAPVPVRHLYGISGRTFALPMHAVTYLPEWTLGICARIDVMF